MHLTTKNQEIKNILERRGMISQKISIEISEGVKIDTERRFITEMLQSKDKNKK